MKFGQEGTTSFSAPPEALKVKFLDFLFFGPRVSRVPQISADFWFLGFLQLFEEAFKITCVLLTFKAYCWQS